MVRPNKALRYYILPKYRVPRQLGAKTCAYEYLYKLINSLPCAPYISPEKRYDSKPKFAMIVNFGLLS